jgi:hypothetical protein
MLTAVEMEYVRALVETMRGKGYKHYVCNTVTETGNVRDIQLVFSTEPVTANSLNSFVVVGGVRYLVDSSGYAAAQGGHNRVAVSAYSGTLVVPDYEFIYTDAEFSGTSVQPDLRQLGGSENETGQAVFLLVALLFLTLVFFRFFGSR